MLGIIDYLPETERKLFLKIIDHVCDEFDITRVDIFDRKTGKTIKGKWGCLAAMHLACEKFPQKTNRKIGLLFGVQTRAIRDVRLRATDEYQKNHSVFVDGVRRINERLAKENLSASTAANANGSTTNAVAAN